LSPEFDPDTGSRLAGYVKEMPLADFSRDYMYRLLGGGSYKVQVRESRTGTFFCHETLNFAGAPKIVAPPSFHDPEPRTHTAPGETCAQPAGRQPSYQEVYQQVRKDIDEERRREEEREERRATREALTKLYQVLESRSGNGNGKGSFMEAVEAVGKLREIVGLGGQGQGGLDGMELIKMLREENLRGENRAKELFEFMQKYSASDGDEKAVLEREGIGLLRDYFTAGRQEKLYERAAETMTKAGKPAEEVFYQVKEEIAKLLEKKFGSMAGMASMGIRGARSVQELLVAIEDLLDSFATDQEEHVGEEKQQPGEPAQPGARSGVKDAD
jgi:hypothetical protein